MYIQVLKPRFRIDKAWALYVNALKMACTSMGFKTVEFENAWKENTGHKHAYFLNSNIVYISVLKILVQMHTRIVWCSVDNHILYAADHHGQSLFD